MALYYATVANIQERVENSAELAALLHEANGEIDTALATAFLEKGQDAIHYYVKPAGYDIPLDVTDGITASWAREITIDLALIYLEVDNRQISEARRLHWEDIMERLRAIRDGKGTVPGVDPVPTDSTVTFLSGANDATLVADGGNRVFNRAAWSGF